jgi:YbbR domain-containing protein
MLRWLGTNIRTFFLALALAIAVWISAVTAADPDETRLFPNTIQIEYIGQDPGLVIKGQAPRQLQLTLRAPSSVWEKLTSQKEAVRALVDLSGIGSGTHTLEVQVQVAERPVRIISFSPSQVELVLEPLVTRSLPVALTLAGKPAIGYQAGAATLTPAEAILSGPQSLVEQVSSLGVTLDITNLRQNADATLDIQVLDEQGTPVNGLTLNPTSVQIHLPITQQGGYRDLVVKVVTMGRPASGYRLTNIAPIPPVVTVFSSNFEQVNALPGYVETDPLDLNGASADIETHLTLNLPLGVTLVGEQSILVQVGIAAIQGSITLTNRPVEVANLADGLQVSLSPEKVDVILSGPLPILDKLAPGDIHVLIDLKDLTPGTYHLTPTIQMVIGDVTVESILPGTIEVVISQKTQP